MSVRQRTVIKNGKEVKVWFYRKRIKGLDGISIDINGTPALNTKVAAEQAERAHIGRVLTPGYDKKKEYIPTFDEWFNGRYWKEWVIARKNKPGTVELKKNIYKTRIKEKFGTVKISSIETGDVASYQSSLIGEGLSDSAVNNMMIVLTSPLKYAQQCGIIDKAPVVRFNKVERPEIDSLEIEEYQGVIKAAAGFESRDNTNDWCWIIAVLLAGEAGLRIGEIKALKWDDIDFIGGSLTVDEQVRKGIIGTPKGFKRRTIIMTQPLRLALLWAKGWSRHKYIIANPDGSMKTDSQAAKAIYDIYKTAGVGSGCWHKLRHTFATHSALFGANPWSLMGWLGHKDMEETIGYVNFAKAHSRTIPEAIAKVAEAVQDPDKKVRLMLGARWGCKETALDKIPSDPQISQPVEIIEEIVLH